MSATFTLNFFRSGIQFGSWGSFQLPGLLNFGEFKVCLFLLPGYFTVPMKLALKSPVGQVAASYAHLLP